MKAAPGSGEPDPLREGAAEAALVERARDGDRTAFEALYLRFAPLVHGVLLAAAPRRDVEDLMQDVFLAAWNGLPRLRDAAQVGGWLATIARNRARRFHSRARPVATLEREVAAEDPVAERTEGTLALEAIRGLPAAYRETLILRLVEGMTGPEIAARTGLTHGSVRVNLSRGMALLRERLGEKGDR